MTGWAWFGTPERAAVVAWLRSDHASACCKDSYADAIERGEHRG